MFKSYYVVWKPLTLSHTENADYMFKSYYVVWKPESFPFFFRFFVRLNRTM